MISGNRLDRIVDTTAEHFLLNGRVLEPFCVWCVAGEGAKVCPHPMDHEQLKQEVFRHLNQELYFEDLVMLMRELHQRDTALAITQKKKVQLWPEEMLFFNDDITTTLGLCQSIREVFEHIISTRVVCFVFEKHPEFKRIDTQRGEKVVNSPYFYSG